MIILSFLFFATVVAAPVTATGLTTPKSPWVIWRQGIVSSAAVSIFPLIAVANAHFFSETAEHVNIQLEAYDSLLCLNFTVDANHGPFRAIVDTGSPFLIVPRVCSNEWGCDKSGGESYKIAVLPTISTVETFGGQEYDVDWRSGDIKFSQCTPTVDAKSNRVTFRTIYFGSVGQDVLLPPGGVFCGLVKNQAKGIKPTLLSQLDYDSFRLDVTGQCLTLSRTPLIPPAPQHDKDDSIEIFDLRRLGAPVQHYATRVRDLTINGERIKCSRNTFAIIDSGTTGCVLSDDIFYNYFTPTPVRSVSVTLETRSGRRITLFANAERRAKNAFIVSPAFVPWAGFRRTGVTKQNPFKGSDRAELPGPSLVVLGMSFLKGRVFTVDIQKGIMLLE